MHKNIAYGGVFAALSVLLITLAAYLPSAKAALLFAASLTVFVLAGLSGVKTAAVMYAAVSVLGFLTARGTSPVVIITYTVCFGSYPLFKKLLSRQSMIFSIIIKVLLYTLYFAVLFVILKFFVSVDFKYSTVLLFAAGAPVFAFYDVLLDRTGEYALKLLNKKL